MTAEKLYGILEFLDSLDTKLELQVTLEGIRDHLHSLVSSPATPQYQSSLASALSTLEAASPKLREAITPSLALAIKSMGGEEFFDARHCRQGKGSRAKKCDDSRGCKGFRR